MKAKERLRAFFSQPLEKVKPAWLRFIIVVLMSPIVLLVVFATMFVVSLLWFVVEFFIPTILGIDPYAEG